MRPWILYAPHLTLRLCAGRVLDLEDLRTGERGAMVVAEDGGFMWPIQRAADFAFLRYSE